MKNKRLQKALLIFLIVILFLGVAALTFFYFINKKINNLIIEELQNSQNIERYIPEGGDDFSKLVPHLLGFDSPKTYLVLFLNNTEMRPGGGFIGTYAILSINKGKVAIEKTEGTEILDNNAPSTPKPTPPAPLSDYLGVDRWWFRDSNWSPDFSESSKKALELYALELGYKANELDGVIGITPTVLEELLGIIGDVKVDDIVFTKENITRKLEYEVEYGYKDRGISIENRKALVGHLMQEIFKKATFSALLRWEDYLNLGMKLAKEKQILLYMKDSSFQKTVQSLGWAGETINEENSDYLEWVDANLGALKTDHAIERDLNYKITKDKNGKLVAKTTMLYSHNGFFDWRTSRYRTYVRVFVPEGSKLIKVVRTEDGKIETLTKIDSGVELYKTWFGTFISIEPGRKVELSFEYYLPEYISSAIDSGLYKIIVQKQPGIIETSLTFDLDFDKNLTGALPPEKEEYWYDDKYNLNTNLRVDREFLIKF